MLGEPTPGLASIDEPLVLGPQARHPALLRPTRNSYRQTPNAVGFRAWPGGLPVSRHAWAPADENPAGTGRRATAIGAIRRSGAGYGHCSSTPVAISIIHKPATHRVLPNMPDYAEARARFAWDDVRAALPALPGGGLNLAHAAVDRHAATARATHVALRWLGKDGTERSFTYADLSRDTARFANVLEQLGVGRGDRVFSLLGRVPALYWTALGTLKHASVFCPLFSQFGPEPVVQRLSRGDARVLVTTTALYQKKIAAWRHRLPSLAHVLLVDARADDNAGADGVRALPPLLDAASPDFPIPPTSPEDPALLHFTSGTTGLPKGAVHVHEAALMHYATGRDVLDLHPDDIYWCTADPGWVTGTSYGIVAPLLHGVTLVVDEAEFDAERWYRILQDHRVTVWYTAPTAIRRLMRIPGSPRDRYDLGALRLVHASASRSTPRPSSGANARSASPSTTTGGRPRRAAS